MNNPGNTGLHPANGRPPMPQPPAPSAPAAPEARPAAAPAPVSRAPLNLGGTGVPVATPTTAPAPAATLGVAPKPPVPGPKPVAPRPAAPAGNGDRITGCKTFFTKLHPGAIDFLDEQINLWLKDNPGVVIKLTNTTTGEVQGKKTEANILMTVWYHGQAAKTATHMG
ncbi:MAG TPA: hypothetical protein VLI39_20975 [Sedimentisphaerales bacterium]|nr:hypothetical protein [Sedimentisphaerales bacterium]